MPREYVWFEDLCDEMFEQTDDLYDDVRYCLWPSCWDRIPGKQVLAMYLVMTMRTCAHDIHVIPSCVDHAADACAQYETEVASPCPVCREVNRLRLAGITDIDLDFHHPVPRIHRLVQQGLIQQGRPS
jgi:hypothetical protein